MRICDDLRQAVLQAAIQGKLTKQLPEDGNAKDLLIHIKAEKERQIRKNKKDKPLTPISESDIPFDIPDNWDWVRFGNIYSLTNGTASRGSKDGFDRPVLRLADLTETKINPQNVRKISLTDKEFDSHLLCPGDLVFIRVNGSKERVASAYLFIGNEIISYCDHLFCGHKVSDAVYPEYVMLAFNSASTRKELSPEIKTTAGQNTISQASMVNIIIPFPPLAEQQRIVTKVDELMARIDDLEKTETELEKLKAAFPGDMKAALLQAAMQGKLTEQLPEDGDAADLINQIVNEKDQLIKEGKIKKEKLLPAIMSEEVPFDIPGNWQWTKIGNISRLVTKGTTPRGGNVSYSNSGIGFLRAENVAGFDKINKRNLNFVNEETHLTFLNRSILKAGDILITIAGTLGRTALVRNEDLPLNANQAVSLIRMVNKKLIDLKYIIYAINSPLIQKSLTDQKKITAIPNLTLEIIANYIIPLPPLAEQKRIVEKLDKLLPLCDGLVEE